jgi:excisionase family DNA binding protein
MTDSTSDVFMTVAELASHLQVDSYWIYRNRVLLRIPSYAFGKHLRFKKSEIDEWELGQKVI